MSRWRVRKRLPDLADMAVQRFQVLKENQGVEGIPGHLAQRRSLAGVLRGRIGSFADQVYPVYALTLFGRVFEVEEAL